jgi:APA family basic amino acid/polyamine antiporter
MPIGLIGSLVICTIFYLLVSGGAVGSIGAQPVINEATGLAYEPGSAGLMEACRDPVNDTELVCSGEPLAHVLDQLGWKKVSQLIGLAAFLALPSVILMMLFGQTRIFFSMARDKLLPFNEALTRVHPRFHTPHVVTIITGLAVTVFASFFPVGVLADLSNSGTLFAFLSVAAGVMILRKRDPERHRPFRVPAVWLVAPVAIAGCAFLLFSLPLRTQLTFFIWAGIGMVVYVSYGMRKSPLRRPQKL